MINVLESGKIPKTYAYVHSLKAKYLLWDRNWVNISVTDDRTLSYALSIGRWEKGINRYVSTKITEFSDGCCKGNKVNQKQSW